MRITKLNDDLGKPIGEVVLRAGALKFRPELCDAYCVAFDAEGLSESGDPLAYQLLLTQNELKFMLGCAAKVRS